MKVATWVNENLSLSEVEDVYLPLARLLNLHITATQNLHQVTNTFLKNPTKKVPYVIGIAGSVAAGKSTTARILQALLAYWPEHSKVDLVTTDGFLFPNRVLEQRNLMRRKGFPESYDVGRLIRFIVDVKSGLSNVTAPVYSHLTYDIVPEEVQTISQPDVLILEGLNVLQSAVDYPVVAARMFVSDFFDFSIYVDTEEQHLKRWYVERFFQLRDTAFQDPCSYFHRYTRLSAQEVKKIALEFWNDINAINLEENIKPTRERAHLILEKRENHAIGSVRLRKL